MPRQDSLTSTDKLLDLIRGKSDPPATPEGTADTRPPKKPFFVLKNPLEFRKSITVGAVLGYHDLKLAEISHSFEKPLELRKYREVPFPPEMNPDHPRFSQFLRNTLNQFCGTPGRIELWSAISSARVEMRYLRVPKVPRKQIANVIYWTYKKEISFNDQEEIFDFEILGDIVVNGTRKTEVMAYSAPIDEIQKLKNTFAKSGYPLTGITIIPFVLQNLLRSEWIKTEGENICSLYIGRDWSRIDIFANRNMVVSRGIKAGMRSMIEAIRQSLLARSSGLSVERYEREAPAIMEEPVEHTDMEAKTARKIFFNFIQDYKFLNETGEVLEVDANEVMQMILPALERLIRQVERTLEHYTMNFESQTVSKIYISGPVSTEPRIVNLIGEQLGLPIDIIDPFKPVVAASDKSKFPKTLPERESFSPAIGLALSNKTITPNFIFTYKDKEKYARVRRVNTTVFTALLSCMVVSFGIYFWQTHLIGMKKAGVRALERTIPKNSPVDQQLIQLLVDEIKIKRNETTQLSRRYISLAVMQEITQIIPANIRLSKMTAEFGGDPGSEKKRRRRLLILDGIISGNRLNIESSLAEFLLSLKNSPVFEKPDIKNRTFVQMDGQEVLRFTAELEIT